MDDRISSDLLFPILLTMNQIQYNRVNFISGEGNPRCR